MSKNYCPILSTLGYVLSPDKRQVLMTYRVFRKDDEQFGKYNGLGGHMEPGEDIATCMIREIREEAAIEVTQMSLRGTVNWTNFGPKWVPREKLMELPMWPGDRYFLPLVFDDDPRPFHGYLPYDHDNPVAWSCVRM